MRGRFAPSPTGPLHFGNLRTALVAWLATRTVGGSFVVRMEDIDPVVSSREHGARQLTDLARLGLDWDGGVVWQSDRRPLYDEVVERLIVRGLTYECFCTRREIQEAAQAPNAPIGPAGAYPGTCRALTLSERAALRANGRSPALRLATDGLPVTIRDSLMGPFTATVDDFVLLRNDGVPAYNLVVVVDDHHQGITQVVRADDLLSSAPRQRYLMNVLGYRPPTYLHVPLVLGADGSRLAKRHGAVTLADLPSDFDALSLLAASLGLATPGESVDLASLLERFDIGRLPRDPWIFST